MSEQENNGLTLEGLAQRLEALERENSELRHKVATLEDSGTRQDEVARLQDSGTTRRLEEPASESSEHEEEGRVSRRWLLNKAGAAALGTVAAGALMLRDTPEARADHLSPGITVDYVVAHSNQANRQAVDARNDADGGKAVYAEALRGNGVGVVAFGGHTGVFGSGDYGGELQGGKAQLRLRPKGSAGAPTTGSHLKGELYLDSNARLFVCTADGTPGTWRSVRTAAT
jgi:hypothetical protein